MDRFLILYFTALHSEERIETETIENKFVMKTRNHSMLLTKDAENFLTCSENFDDAKVFCKKFYPNGKLYISLVFLSGRKNGPYEEYFENGNIHIQCSFYDDLLDGLETKYNELGNKVSETMYVEGLVHGTKKVYENGVLRFIYNCKNGKSFNVQEYLDGSILKAESEMYNKKLHGKFQEYHPNGKCKRLIYAVEGLFQGDDIHYDLNGKIHCVGTMVNSKKHGKYNYYNTLGDLTHFELYENGVKLINY
jgi:antitoxin component YwqK of YwqJK toxin-antitoxin module